MEWKVPLADLDYGEEENQAVLDVLRRRWLTMGAVTQEFESQFANLTGARHTLAVSNATLALHLACVALGIGPGDEVIVPSLTFVATSNAVLYTGAEVRFADISGPEEFNISPAEIERLVTPRTRAVIVMHYAGFPCRMNEILEIAGLHNLAVIEDVAHAPGASLDGRALGVWGDIGCFSFFSNKNLSTGEGGMLVTQRDDLAQKLRLLRSHGMTSLTWDRHKGHAYTYDVVELGYNYRIDEIRSALGLVQLQKLGANNARRAAITAEYWRKLPGGGDLPFERYAQEPGVLPAYHIFPYLLPDGSERKVFMDAMRSAGIQTSIHYPPIHRFTYYRQRFPGIVLPLTERLAEREVTLPLYPGMDLQAVQSVVEAVQQALDGKS
jgi:dTDP-4-amino-4,6-dideoxygalactose transaminase